MCKCDKNVNFIKNDIYANGNISSEYIKRFNPFDSNFENKPVNEISIPIKQVSRFVQSKLFVVITTPDYNFGEEYRPIFNHIDNEGVLNELSDFSTTPCNKIVIRTKNIGKLKMSDGLIRILSLDHPEVKGNQVYCSDYEERGSAACKNCSISFSDNDDLFHDDVEGCPYEKCYVSEDSSDTNDNNDYEE